MLLIIIEVIISIVLLLLLALLAVLLALLFVPFRFEGMLARNAAYQVSASAAWFWGIIQAQFKVLPNKKSVSIKLLGIRLFARTLKPKEKELQEVKITTETEAEKARIKAERKAEKKAKRRTKKEKESKKKPSAGEIFDQIAEGYHRLSLEAVAVLLQSVVRLFLSLRLKLVGKAEAGLPDPADTGILLGAFYAISGALNQKNFRLQPNWDETTIRGEVTISGRLWLADIMRIALKMALASSIRKIWWPYAKERLNPFRRRPKPQIA